MTDTERLNFLEALAAHDPLPFLYCDGNGNWAVVHEHTEWRGSIREAIDAAMERVLMDAIEALSEERSDT